MSQKYLLSKLPLHAAKIYSNMCFYRLELKTMQHVNMVARFIWENRFRRQPHSLKQSALELWEIFFENIMTVLGIA